MTTKDLADRTGFSRRTIREKIAMGEFGEESFQVSGRYLVTREAFEQWLTIQRVRGAIAILPKGGLPTTGRGVKLRVA